MKRSLSSGFFLGLGKQRVMNKVKLSSLINHSHHHPNNNKYTCTSSRTFSSSSIRYDQLLENQSSLNNKKKKTTVVLCHGCFGFASQFFLLEKRLIESGKYRVLNYWYPSYRQSIERSSEGLYHFLNEHRFDEEHVLSRTASLWYHYQSNQYNIKKEEQSSATVATTINNTSSVINNSSTNNDDEYNFVTHSMGSMIVRNFLVNMVQNNNSRMDSGSGGSSGNINDILLRQDCLKLIQVSPLLGGRVKLARDLKFLNPIAKALRSFPEEPTIVEQFMNHQYIDGLESWEEVFSKSFWWNQDSILTNKIKMTNIVTSLREFQRNEPALFSDLVLTVDEQTSTLPVHLNSHTELVYIKGDHASILNRDVCIDKILQTL